MLGIKVRVGKSASGDSSIMPMDIALDVAEECGLPLMAHLDAPPPSRHEVMSRLRPGDILTHCFRPFPNAPVRADGKVRDERGEIRRHVKVFVNGEDATRGEGLGTQVPAGARVHIINAVSGG